MVIFIAGVYGVGKSSLCAKLSRQLGVPWFTASDIIKQERGAASWGRQKLTSEIERNQASLISGVRKLSLAHERIILDGHFALLNQDRSINLVSMETFVGLNVEIAVLLEDDSERIARRLFERDKESWDLRLLNRLGLAERKRAEEFSRECNVPLGIFNYNSAAEVSRFLRSFL
ncbi:ATP-binding protein [Pseudomonas aeruginosa]